MSAFVVSRNHISYLVQAAQSRRLNGGHGHMIWYWDRNRETGSMKQNEIFASDYAKATRTGQMLWDENIKSVMARYSDCSRENLPGPIGEDFIFKFQYNVNISIDPVQVLKACDCFEYQSCEHAEWEESEAYAFIETLRAHAWHRLPGYDDAKWEIK